MAERSSLTQTVQWGVEAVGSTGTTGDVLMSALGYEPSIRTEGGTFRPAGRKWPTLSWIGKEWSEGSISGQATYTEIPYPLSSVLSAPTTSAPATGAWKYSFTTDPTGSDQPRTFSIEAGEDNNWNYLTGVIINELSLSVTRDSIELSGSAYGRAIQQKATPMTAATGLTPRMILPADVNVYWHTTFAGATGEANKLERVMSVDFSVGDRYNPVWVLDRAQSSYVASVEGEPRMTATVLMEADAEGMARLAELQAATTIYLRVNATSTETISGSNPSTPYSFDLVMAGKVSDAGDFNDQDGVYAIEWTVTGIESPDFGPSGGIVKIDVVNDLNPATAKLNL